MKYEKEIDQLLRDIIYEYWMDEEDYNEVITEIFKQLGSNKEKLSSDIEIGIKNGYSIETQFALVKRVLNAAKVYDITQVFARKIKTFSALLTYIKK